MILWAIFYREAFGLEIYLDVTLIRTICLTIVTDQEIVFPDGCGPSSRIMHPTTKQKMLCGRMPPVPVRGPGVGDR